MNAFALSFDPRAVVCECGCGSIIFDLTSEQYERERRPGCIVVLPGHVHGRAVVRSRRGFAVVALGLLSDTGWAPACTPVPVSLSRSDVVDADVTGSAPRCVGEGDGSATPAVSASRASGRALHLVPLDAAAVGGWAPGVAAVASSGTAGRAGNGAQGDPATAPAEAHESPGDEQHRGDTHAAEPLSRSTCASTTTGGTTSGPGRVAAVASDDAWGVEPGSALRHLRDDAEALTREFRKAPHTFK